MSKLPTPYQDYIHLSRYSRWRDDVGRRETWEETVDRYLSFFKTRNGYTLSTEEETALKNAILSLNVMPSMRCLMTAGEALARDNVAGFNCSYVAVDDPIVFDEIMYVLMCGTGVGFSVERQYVSKLPIIPEQLEDSDETIVVEDSKIGWATALRQLILGLYGGRIHKWDTSGVRPAGSRLVTFGGRASGPAPLEDLFRFTVDKFKGAAGRKLHSIEVHDIVCKIADIVVVGGVRRSALISLSNLSDDRMRLAKSGAWWEDEGQRALANNSACYTEKPELSVFMKEWSSLYDSHSGERGIFSRVASQNQALKNGRRDGSHEFGTNPCSEIILRSKQFCNLSEVVVRPTDTLTTLKEKVRLATILGTLQATLTDFRYLSDTWKKNTDEEALLGVSLTGILDHPIMSDNYTEADVIDFIGFVPDGDGDILGSTLNELKQVAVETNRDWAARLGVNHSTAITCVKPSGTVSQLVDSASGIHPRYAPFYIRRVRADKKDPLSSFMRDAGFHCETDVMKETNMVFSFPVAAPKNALFTKDMGAMRQLALWKKYQDKWCEHKPSITVYYTDDDFMAVGAWVWENFDAVSGVSFLPYSGHTYRQAPYEEITEEKYNALVAMMPTDVDWGDLKKYEKDDQTVGSQTLACTGNSCEL